MGLNATYPYDKNGRPLRLIGSTKYIYDDKGVSLESTLSQISNEALKKRFYFSLSGFPDVGDSDCLYCNGTDFYVWDTGASKYSNIISETASSALEKAHTHANKIILDAVTKAFTVEDFETLYTTANTAATAVQSIKIGEKELVKSGSEVVLPVYPTRDSLEINMVNNTSDLDKPISNSAAEEFQTVRNELANESSRAESAEKANNEAITAEISRATLAEEALQSIVNINKPIWDDKYTKNEVDNKFSALETAIDWKEAVDTYADLTTTYPHPDDGWTVNVKDTDYTYRWDGTSWIAISANAIPKATQDVDGLLSKEDKINYDNTYSKSHTHSNKSTLDKITETLFTNWTAAYTHISNAVKHITETERRNWNDANSKKHTHDNKGVIDKLTQAMLDKLSGIASGAEVNVQSDWSITDTNSDSYIKNKPTSMPASDVPAWAKATVKPSYAWTEIGSKPSTFPPTSHSHTINQISDMPTNLSQFTNDKGFLTAIDIDTSQNHTHSNKVVLDKISQTMLDKLDDIAPGAEVNVQSDWSADDPSLDSYIKNKPTSMPASDVPSWAKASSKPSYVWNEINDKPSTFPPFVHTHDSRYYTEEEVDTKFRNINPAYIKDGYTSKSFYLNTHPENSGVLIPFINNDIAYLLKRGGSAKIMYDGVEKTLDISNVFDGSPSYWLINPTGVTEIVIELTLYKTFVWSNTIYIDFGSASWRAKNITIDVMNSVAGETDWTNKASLTDYALGHYKIMISHNDGVGFNKVRFSLSSWNNSERFRISAIGIVNYGSSGLREVFLPRDGGALYGSVTPFDNKSFDLGSSSKMWRNIYGNLSGNATSATKLSTARSINGSSFDGSSNITTSKWGTARWIKIGNTAKAVDGSADVTFTASELGLPAETILKNILIPVSSFTDLTANYSNPSISPNQIPDVIFDKASQSVAAKAGITVSTETEKLVITALRLPESDLTIESLILKDAG